MRRTILNTVKYLQLFGVDRSVGAPGAGRRTGGLERSRYSAPGPEYLESFGID
jgi:hypothetical protein